MSLPRYAEYKDSDIAWLGEVPAHWDIAPLKRMLDIQNGSDHKHIEVDDGYPVIGSGGPFACASEYIYDGESVLLGRKGTVDRPLFATGKFWTVDTMYWTKVSPDASGKFCYYAALTIPFDLYSTNTALPSMTKGVLSAHPIVRPSFEEQSAIAAFLDRETGKIDALIAEQEELLTLLAEKRQATISHAVTRGLNPNAPTKDSGVRWLGEVPAHWEVTSLGRISVSRCDGPFGSGIKSDHYTDEGALVVRLQNIRAYAFNIGEPVYLDQTYFETSLRGHEVAGGDLLVAGLGDEKNLLGRACVAPEGLGAALVKADCFRFRLRQEQALPHFVALQLSAGAAFDAGVMATGTTRSRMPLGVMSSRKVVLPSVPEQSEIIAFVDAKLSQFDVLRKEAEGGIELLKERRSALIAAAVTGKIDVRQHA